MCPAECRHLGHFLGQPPPAPGRDLVDIRRIEMIEALDLPVRFVYQAAVEELAQAVVYGGDRSARQFLERQALEIPVLRQPGQDGLVGRGEAPGGVLAARLGGEAVTTWHGPILAAERHAH